MKDKFTIEDFFIKIIPGGILLGVLYFMYGNSLNVEIPKGMDFLYTTIYFIFSFLIGEVIQTIAHELEWLINIFFKFYKPSEIFLYKNNPVIKNERIRNEIVEFLSIPEKEKELFNNAYKNLPLLKKRQRQDVSQSYFWKLYTSVSKEDNIKIFNRNYLYIRAIVFLFLILSILFFLNDLNNLFITSILLFLIFLWRARGMARTLVFKTVILNLKKV